MSLRGRLGGQGLAGRIKGLVHKPLASRRQPGVTSNRLYRPVDSADGRRAPVTIMTGFNGSSKERCGSIRTVWKGHDRRSSTALLGPGTTWCRGRTTARAAGADRLGSSRSALVATFSKQLTVTTFRSERTVMGLGAQNSGGALHRNSGDLRSRLAEATWHQRDFRRARARFSALRPNPLAAARRRPRRATPTATVANKHTTNACSAILRPAGAVAGP